MEEKEAEEPTLRILDDSDDDDDVGGVHMEMAESIQKKEKQNNDASVQCQIGKGSFFFKFQS